MSKNDNYEKQEVTKEARDHKICLKRGFSSTTEDNDKLIKYYKCRMAEASARMEQPPFAATSYSEYKDSFSEKSVNAYMNKRKLQLKTFNFCRKFLRSQITFGNCVKSYISYEKCLTNIPNKIVKKQQDDLVFCKEQSVKQFPDEMAIHASESDYSGPRFSKTDTIELRNEFNKRCLKNRGNENLEYAMGLPEKCETKLNSWK